MGTETTDTWDCIPVWFFSRFPFLATYHSAPNWLLSGRVCGTFRMLCFETGLSRDMAPLAQEHRMQPKFFTLFFSKKRNPVPPPPFASVPAAP